MKKLRLAILVLISLMFTQGAYVLTWVTSLDGNISGSPETVLTLGVSDVGLVEWDTASAGTFGTGANLGSGFTSHTVQFTHEFNSWDSYNDIWGYGDVFLIALTEGDYYWNLPITHPVWDDAQLIWHLQCITAWGGDEWGDDILDNEFGNDTLVFNVDWTKDYYLNLILDTSNGGEYFPSWGYVSDFQIRSTSSIPEPSTIILLGSGLAGLAMVE